MQIVCHFEFDKLKNFQGASSPKKLYSILQKTFHLRCISNILGVFRMFLHAFLYMTCNLVISRTGRYPSFGAEWGVGVRPAPGGNPVIMKQL